MNLQSLVSSQICPRILLQEDKGAKIKSFLYESDLSKDSDIGEFIFTVTNYIILKLLDVSSVQVSKKLIGDRGSLSFFEGVFNREIWARFDQSESNLRIVAQGWIRLVSLYKRIIVISENYPNIADNMEIRKRIFNIDPVVLELNVPALFLNTKTKGVDILSMVPVRGLSNPYYYFIIDYLSELGLKCSRIHEFCFSPIDNKRHDYYYSELLIPSWYIDEARLYIKSLKNNTRANVNYCPMCPYSCTHQDKKKVVKIK